MIQKEIRILGTTKKMEFLPLELVRRCKTTNDAIRLCVQWGRVKQTVIAEVLDMNKGHISRALSGQAYFPPAKIKALEELCGNYAVTQFDCWDRGMDRPVLRSADTRISELEAELARVRAETA